MNNSNAVAIVNPILKGFNPDPSIIRVGDDYYIATSTFEWFPGVQIHHSRDLRHWRLLTRPLDRVSQLNLLGVPSSGGVWAPCLSCENGVFYLVYTVVHTLNSGGIDTHNYLVTSPNIEGPWSEPVYLNSNGFDPSLFHEDNNRKWLLKMVYDHRPEKYPFYGITLQEFDFDKRVLIGTPEIIFKGTSLGCTEGPHIYQRNGYYYLILAEGGTGWNHCVSMLRSRDIYGPYELHPENPVLTSQGDGSLALQKAGHADLVATQAGEWYLVHLCSRPTGSSRSCMLGRETAIQAVEWRDDDWLYLRTPDNRPQLMVDGPDLKEAPWDLPLIRDNFDAADLPLHYQSPRVPLDDQTVSLSERPGFLRLKGAESLSSCHRSVLVARRQQAFCCRAVTRLEFKPLSFQQMAGLVCYYSTKLYHYFYMSLDEQAGICLRVETRDDGKYRSPLGEAVIPLNSHEVYLQARLDHEALTFLYSYDGEKWQHVCDELDATILSDDYGTDWGFTGTFLGMACQDLSGARHHADFDFFEYCEMPIKQMKEAVLTVTG